MDFDFYLSEMSVSDLHGGGLTLQRIVGDDLMAINWFAHLSRMANDLPATSKIIDKGINLSSFWDSNTSRAILGNSYARNISRNKFFLRLNAKRAAATLNSKLRKGNPINGLVCPQGAATIYTLEALKIYRPVQYVSWVMDDHVVKYDEGSWKYPDSFEQVFRKHLREARHVFVISEVMQAFYYERFGIKSTVLFGPTDFLKDFPSPDLKGKTFNIGYFGAVASWQIDVLAFLVKSLIGTNMQLHIYSTIEHLPSVLQSENVQFKGRIPAENVLSVMKSYHAILLPISFLDKERNKSEFNIATKMSEYLGSGTPILAIGPEYAAMIKYLKHNNAAVLVEHCDEKSIRNGFRLFDDSNKIKKILENAKTLVMNETGVKPMRKRWLDGIN